MNYLLNGKQAPLDPRYGSFGEFLEGIKEELNSGDSIVTSVKIDGIMLSAENQTQLSGLDLNQINILEVETDHPTQFFIQILDSLNEFTIQLDMLTESLSQLSNGAVFEDTWLKLIDGIEVFFDSLESLKILSQRPFSPAVKVLEEDLKSILEDLVQARSNNHEVFVKELLQVHLPTNLKSWLNDGFENIKTTVMG